METPRIYSGFSSLIDIRRLERPARRLLYVGFLFAILFHGLLSVFVTFKAPYQRVKPLVEKPEKPIRVDIIVVPPRNLKPYTVTERRFGKKSILRPVRPGGITDLPGIPFRTLPQFGEMRGLDRFRTEPAPLPIQEMKSDMDQNLAFKDSMNFIGRPTHSLEFILHERRDALYRRSRYRAVSGIDAPKSPEQAGSQGDH